MKFKDYLNSLVSKRKSSTPSSKSHSKSVHVKTSHDLKAATDCHYDICGYEDVNNLVTEDQATRTQILLARHAELVNTIVGTRSPCDSTFASCSQCRLPQQSMSKIPPPLPPPLPPKFSLDPQTSFSNRNYSSTLATCSPYRESQQQYQQHSHLFSSQYSTPNPSAISSSNSSLWTTTTTATGSLSKKQRSRIRTNPWIGNTPANNRSSTYIESSNSLHHHIPSTMASISQPEYEIYDPTFRTLSSSLIHSDSFPKTISSDNISLVNSGSPPTPVPEPAPTSSIILHQSDSGHGFSLSSSRVINSSSSSASSSPPPSSSSSAHNTSGDGGLSNDQQSYRQKKLKKKVSSTPSPLVTHRYLKENGNTEKNSGSHTISSDSGSLTRRAKGQILSPKVTVQYRYQRPSTDEKNNSVKHSTNRTNQESNSRSSSSRSIDDHFSLEFEEILENERSHKHRKDKQPTTKPAPTTSISPRKNPFILPLDEINIKLPSPPPILFSPTLTKTNSRAILKHIEEIENEIRLIKNLDLNREDLDDDDIQDDDEFIISSNAVPDEEIAFICGNQDDHGEDDADKEVQDSRTSIYEQVDQWVDDCLKTTHDVNDSTTFLHTDYDDLSNVLKDYVRCEDSDNNQQSSSIPPPPPPQPSTPKLVTAFYLSSIPTRTNKRTSSFMNEPLKLEQSQTVSHHLKSIHECPF